MKWFWLVVVLAMASLAGATIVAKSTKNECVNRGGQAELQNQDGKPCKQKLVVALTVTADEGKAQSIEADVAVVTDATTKQAKNLQLRNPVRISINKSPVLINYRMFQVGHVPSYAHMVVAKRRSCKDYWYAKDHEAACGFAHDRNGEKIFDSQGYCCGNFGQCLEFDEYSYYIFGLYPAQMHFTITVDIQQLGYSTVSGEDVWNKVSTLEIGPHKRIAVSKKYDVKVEYIADFNPSEFASTRKLAERYILVPDRQSKGFRHKQKVFPEQSSYHQSRFLKSFKNVSEWLAVRKDMFDLTGTSCYKIGVHYNAFRNIRNCLSEAIQEQLSRAMMNGERKTFENAGVCTRNQPYKLWESDILAKSEGRKGMYMLHYFGHVHSSPSATSTNDYQLNFIARRPAKSLIMISMVADDLRTIVRNSPGRIVEAFIEPFEALSNTGLLTAIIQNTGTLSSIYNVFVVHCTAGIDMVPSETVALDPNMLGNISFSMHSFHAVGKINHCELELYDANSEILDNLTVYFETLDTCFCYGYCGCACGNGSTTCPETPEHDVSKLFESYKPPKWVTDIVDMVGGNFGKIVAGTWIFMALIILGALKVVHMLITGEISYNSITNPMGTINNFKKKCCDSCSPHIRDCCLRYCDCERCCLYLCAKCFKGMGQGQFETHANKEKRGWTRPRTCDGMCSGAKRARRVHRKQMRINKRKYGAKAKEDTAWYEKRYVCTCKVKDTMPICDICKGLCFFFYCPLLPVIWALEFLWSFVRRKWKRHQRKKRFRAMRASIATKKQQEYLHLDKYSRGKVEKEILEVNEGVATLRKQKKDKENANFVQDMVEFEIKAEEEMCTDPSQSSDTTDTDEAGDMEELLNPGFPVYFNYALAQSTPSSLKSPGTSFSIKGRIRQVEGSYVFDLHKYIYQVKAVVKQKEIALPQPVPLDSCEFTQSLDETKALKLVTLIPLFTKLNDAQLKR